MAIKRKFDYEAEDAVPNNAKHLKLIPFPNYEPEDMHGNDMDVTMADAEPLPTRIYHASISSTASSSSSSASDSPSACSPPYPTFDLYPLGASQQQNVNGFTPSYTESPSPTNSPFLAAQNVGLIQPVGHHFSHHGNCSQIPKLRIACSPGLNGQRTMWSVCEQCGAISMVEND